MEKALIESCLLLIALGAMATEQNLIELHESAGTIPPLRK
jgi:hypothetical protein